jgi:hypothetical protein
MTSPHANADQMQVSTAKKINGSGFIFILSEPQWRRGKHYWAMQVIEHSIQNGTDRRPLYDEARFSGKIREKMWVCWDDAGVSRSGARIRAAGHKGPARTPVPLD